MRKYGIQQVQEFTERMQKILLDLTWLFLFLFVITNKTMLSNISVNLMTTSSRPESANTPHRITGSNMANYNAQGHDSVFLNNDKIIIPLKEYSNKFLRENKPRQQLIYNHSVIKPKKSLIYVRKELKNRKSRYGHLSKDKQNESYGRSLKTQISNASQTNKSQAFAHSVCGVCEDDRDSSVVWRCATSTNKIQRISTSRALEMFSKVFKNQNIERMKIKKQIHPNTSDVQVRQVTFQDKEEKKKVTVGIARKPNIHPASVLHRKNKKSLLFMEDENFELAGW